MPDFSIGVDLGGTNLRIAAVTGDGRLLEKVTLGTKVALGRDHVINEMCDAIHRLSAKYQEAGKLLGAGIGVPGIIDMQTGMLRKSANLPGWEEYPVRAEIEKRIDIDLIEENSESAAEHETWGGVVSKARTRREVFVIRGEYRTYTLSLNDQTFTGDEHAEILGAVGVKVVMKRPEVFVA